MVKTENYLQLAANILRQICNKNEEQALEIVQSFIKTDQRDNFNLLWDAMINFFVEYWKEQDKTQKHGLQMLEISEEYANFSNKLKTILIQNLPARTSDHLERTLEEKFTSSFLANIFDQLSDENLIKFRSSNLLDRNDLDKIFNRLKKRPANLLKFFNQNQDNLETFKYRSSEVVEIFIEELRAQPSHDLLSFLAEASLETFVYLINLDPVNVDLANELRKIPQTLFQFLRAIPFMVESVQRLIPDLFLMRDEFGNSLLFALSLDEDEDEDEDKNKNKNEKIIKNALLLEPQAKLIRGGREIRNRLILMIAALGADEEIDAQFLTNHLHLLGQTDESGRTPLHWAIILGKNSVINQLLAEQDIDFSIPDKMGRNAVHYLILQNKFTQFASILTAKSKEMFARAINQEDRFGVSPLAMACFVDFEKSKDKEPQEFDINQIYQHPDYQIEEHKFDQLFLEICQNLGFIAEQGKIIIDKNKHQELKAELEKIYQRTDIDDNLKRYIFCAFAKYSDSIWEIYEQEKLQLKLVEEFQPVGVELELVNFLPPIPSLLLRRVYDVFATTDHTVNNAIGMYDNRTVQEVVSGVIKNQKQFENFLAMCGDFETAQAMVNPSTGLHVHTNFNSLQGRLVDKVIDRLDDKNLSEHQKDQIEFLLLKQIMVNFAAVQLLLQGFMRNGDLFYDNISTSKLILAEEQQINKFNDAKSIEDLYTKVFPDRYFTLNIRNLDPNEKRSKGTLEFRCHEGAVNPTIIEAWVNFVQRLVAISVDQVAEILNSTQEPIAEKITNFKVEARENIEDLVYLLIAERRYDKTWDPKLGSVPSQYDYGASPIPGSAQKASDPNPLAGEIAQEVIRDSLFYRSIQEGRVLEGVKNPKDAEQLENIFKLQRKYPNILSDLSADKNSPHSSPKSGVTKGALMELGLEDTPLL
ncbi:MAG: ankyrin repeat domain-containing protein [Pseudomonadota bacterium]